MLIPNKEIAIILTSVFIIIGIIIGIVGSAISLRKHLKV